MLGENIPALVVLMAVRKDERGIHNKADAYGNLPFLD
jgi:hypothetical protein